MNKHRELIERRHNYENGVSSLNVTQAYRLVRKIPFKWLLWVLNKNPESNYPD